MTVNRTVLDFSNHAESFQQNSLTFEEFLLELCFCNFDLYRFVDLFIMAL